MSEQEFLVYTSYRNGPRVIIAPPGGQPWTAETVERWIATAKHTPGGSVFVDRRRRGAPGPFPGTRAPFLEWRVYRVGDDGRAVVEPTCS